MTTTAQFPESYSLKRNSQRSDAGAPIVEPISDEAERVDHTTHLLRQRIRQQEILAELGVFALRKSPFLDLLNQTARLTAEGLEAQFCKVLEYLPAENRFLVRAGVGWQEGIVGKASVGADLESPAGFALHTGKPVISNHLENEQRFRTPELLLEHGIRRAMNVILQGDGSAYGVLEVDSQSEGEFSERDIAFLQGAANILGMAIERQRYERQLKAALDRHQVLANEMSHRVKNSLQIASSMLHLHAGTTDDDVLRTPSEGGIRSSFRHRPRLRAVIPRCGSRENRSWDIPSRSMCRCHRCGLSLQTRIRGRKGNSARTRSRNFAGFSRQ